MAPEKPKPFVPERPTRPPMGFPEGDPRNPTVEDMVASTGRTPEELGYVESAAEAIGGLGATAMSSEVQPTEETSNQGGFLRRAGGWVKDSLKQVWEEQPAVKAVTEVGGSFTKWDIAKVVTRNFFVDASAVAARGVTGQYDAMNKRAALARSGATSGTMRRKLAEGQLDAPRSNNPVTQHLNRKDFPAVANHAVAATRRQIQEDRKYPEEARIRKQSARVVGLVGMAAVTPLVAKGLIDTQALEFARDVVTFK